jgi:hypothetical protein
MDVGEGVEEVNPFHDWLALQHQLQIEAFHADPTELTPEERAGFLIWNAFAVEDELHEAMQEVGWKPWASSRHMNRAEFIDEIVDAMHFLGNMLLCAMEPEYPGEGGGLEGLADDIWVSYRNKVQVNIDRQRDGYDGVSEKCPQCKRQLDTHIITDDSGPVSEYTSCSEHGVITRKDFRSGQGIPSTNDH